MTSVNLLWHNYAVVGLKARLITALCVVNGTPPNTTKCKVNSFQEGYRVYFAII